MKNIRNGMLFLEELGEHGLIVDAEGRDVHAADGAREAARGGCAPGGAARRPASSAQRLKIPIAVTGNWP